MVSGRETAPAKPRRRVDSWTSLPIHHTMHKAADGLLPLGLGRAWVCSVAQRLDELLDDIVTRHAGPNLRLNVTLG